MVCFLYIKSFFCVRVMVHLERIHEELRVLNLKDEKLLSPKAFANFSKRLDLLNGILFGLFPRKELTPGERVEKNLLDEYFKTFKENFYGLYEDWYRMYG